VSCSSIGLTKELAACIDKRCPKSGKPRWEGVQGVVCVDSQSVGTGPAFWQTATKAFASVNVKGFLTSTLP
jgi:hypothetical protein